MCLNGINGMVGFRYLSPAHLQGFNKYKVSIAPRDRAARPAALFFLKDDHQVGCGTRCLERAGA